MVLEVYFEKRSKLKDDVSSFNDLTMKTILSVLVTRPKELGSKVVRFVRSTKLIIFIRFTKFSEIVRCNLKCKCEL